MTQNPLPTRLPICVIIPAYNRAHMLERALNSVWSQQPGQPMEVIVVDDGSSDDTADVAARFGARVVRHPQNRGLAAARNTGLHATSHPWIAFLDSDDEWLPHHLAHLWDLRDGHALVAGSAFRCGIDPADDRFHGPTTRRPLILNSGDQLVYPENMIPVSASMCKRDVAIDVGGFQARHGVVEDLDLWLRILAHHTGVCSPRVSIVYHLHGEQMSSELALMLRGHRAASEAHRERTDGSRIPLQRWEGVAAWCRMYDALKTGKRRDFARWALYTVSRPHRMRGLLGITLVRYHSRRRTAALHAAGIGPHHRENAGLTSHTLAPSGVLS
jgi:glycosyltransferase involved in cell wall biosynthesis